MLLIITSPFVLCSIPAINFKIVDLPLPEVPFKKTNSPAMISKDKLLITNNIPYGSIIYVKDGQRGKGIGKLLMQPLIDAVKEMKLHTIIAGIDADNKLSIEFHKQFGFVEVAHFKEVGWKFERWLDLVFMQLIIV